MKQMLMKVDTKATKAGGEDVDQSMFTNTIVDVVEEKNVKINI